MTAREVIEQALLPDVPKWTRYADKVLAALDEAGLVVVPKEATDAMLKAVGCAGRENMVSRWKTEAQWRAMVAAALSSNTAS